jgi:polyhydroxybutyrate depolymerase
MREKSWLAIVLVGCGAASPIDGGVDSGSVDAGRESDAGTTDALPETIGGDRPARLVVPDAHDGETALPAIVLLHGYSVNGSVQDFYFRFARSVEDEGFYGVIPDGTQSSTGQRFWNATPACCNFEGTDVDDVAYLTGLIDELEALVPVSAVYFLGHSNGGFMSYRMACEQPDRVDAIVSLAGSDFLADDGCVPSRPVSVLQIHGDLDPTIQYGGTLGYPSATDVVERWAVRAGCDATPTAGTALDLVTNLDGAETTVAVYANGCDGTEDAELWTIVGGNHAPPLGPDFMPSVFAWMRAHAR